MDWEQIFVVAVPVLAGIGVVWSRLAKISVAAKECGDVLITAAQAIEDKELTKDEIKAIKKEFLEAAAALKAIFK